MGVFINRTATSALLRPRSREKYYAYSEKQLETGIPSHEISQCMVMATIPLSPATNEATFATPSVILPRTFPLSLTHSSRKVSLLEKEVAIAMAASGGFSPIWSEEAEAEEEEGKLEPSRNPRETSCIRGKVCHPQNVVGPPAVPLMMQHVVAVVAGTVVAE